METFIRPQEMVENPDYPSQKVRMLASLSPNMIEEPLVSLVERINSLSQCFTLQCCYGHFLYQGQDNPSNIELLPALHQESRVEYRIAYIALCIENSHAGRELLALLKSIPAIDPGNIQFCCAHWFWQRQVNSYVLQVEPDRYKDKDKVMLDYDEALVIERAKTKFFKELALLLP